MGRWYGTGIGKSNEQIWIEGQAEEYSRQAEKAQERERSYEPSSSSGAGDAAAAAIGILVLLGVFWLAWKIIKLFAAQLMHVHNSLRARYGSQAVQYEFLAVLAMLVVVIWSCLIIYVVLLINPSITPAFAVAPPTPVPTAAPPTAAPKATNVPKPNNLPTATRLIATAVPVAMTPTVVLITGRPSDVTKFNNHYYKVYRERLTWNQARNRCASLGGYLVTVTSREENDFVWQLAKRNPFPEWTTTWLGATDQAEEGKWLWITRESFNLSGYLITDGGKNENYLNMRLSTGKWEDFPDVGERNGEQWLTCEWDK